MLFSEEIGLPTTDVGRWRLRTTPLGAQKWEYLEKEDPNDLQDNMTKYLLNSEESNR